MLCRSGCWRLEPLPSGPRPEAVSAVLAQQQQPQQELLWGTVSTSQLLADLQVRLLVCSRQGVCAAVMHFQLAGPSTIVPQPGSLCFQYSGCSAGAAATFLACLHWQMLKVNCVLVLVVSSRC